MSQAQRNEKDKKKRARQSLPVMPIPPPGFFVMGQPNPMSQVQPMQPNAVGQWGTPAPMWNPYYGPMAGPSSSTSTAGMAMAAVASPAPSTSKGHGRGFGQGQPANPSLPWESSDDSEEDSDDDFQPSKKAKSSNKAAKSASKPAALSKHATEKRGPGRPSKGEAAQRAKTLQMKSTVLNYPPSFNGEDQIAFLQVDECSSCKIFLGRVMFKPCGHGKYCFTCVNKLRNLAVRNERPGGCFSANCFRKVHSWLQVFNVSAC